MGDHSSHPAHPGVSPDRGAGAERFASITSARLERLNVSAAQVRVARPVAFPPT